MNELIDKELQFYGFTDFFQKKERIKEKYKTLTLREIQTYKMFVYAICFETENTKDIIWEYLNSTDKFTDLKIYQEYGIRERRNKRNARKEERNVKD